MLLRYPAVAIEFAAVCAKRAEKHNNKLAKATAMYAQKAKNCQHDLSSAAEHAVFASKCALHATISESDAPKSSEQRQKVLKLIEDETAWQIRTLTAMLNTPA